MNDLFGIGCPHEVYDTADEQTWVNCSLEKARATGIAGIVVILIVVLIFIFYNSIYAVKMTVFVAGMALIAATLYYMAIGAENLARRRYRRVDEVIGAEKTKFNLEKNVAASNYIKKIQKERDHEMSVRVQIIASVTTFLALALSMGVASAIYGDWITSAEIK